MDEQALPPPDDVPAVSAEELVDGQERGEARRYPSTLGGLLYLLVLAGLLVGIGTVVVSDWRLGTRIIAGSLICTALFRLVLPEKDAGMLAVRNRFLDAFFPASAGIILLVLATSIPNQPGV